MNDPSLFPIDDLAPEAIVRSERIYEGRIINLRIDEVKRQGHTFRWEIVEHGGASVVIAQPDPHSVVLVRQWRHAAGRSLWEVPAGSMDAGESAEECARRELEEETGYRLGNLRHLWSAFTAPGFCSEYLHFFHAYNVRPGPADPDVAAGEELQVRTMSLSEVKEALERNDFADMKTMLALNWLLQSGKTNA